MTSSSPQQHKYRPSLTALQIAHIVKLAEEDIARTGDSYDSLSIIRSLSPLLVKINTGAIKSSYVSTPMPSIFDKLGEAPTSTPPTPSPSASMSKKEYNHKCYIKYHAHMNTCTPEEINAAKEHAYINDLMTASEEQEYEKEIAALEADLRKEL